MIALGYGMVFYIAGLYLGDTRIQKLFPDCGSHCEVPSVIALGMRRGLNCNCGNVSGDTGFRSCSQTGIPSVIALGMWCGFNWRKWLTPAFLRIVMCGDSLRMMHGLKTIC